MKKLWKNISAVTLFIFFTAVFCLICFINFSVARAQEIQTSRNSVWEIALSFVKNAPIPDDAKKIVSDSISLDFQKSLIVEAENGIYSLCALPFPNLENQSTFSRNSIKKNFSKRAQLQATIQLTEYLDKGKLNRKIFQDKEAADYALRIYYSGKIKGGFQSVSQYVDNFALSLVWVEKTSMNDVLSNDFSVASTDFSNKEFIQNYCSFLYNKAQNFFKNRDFGNALKTFHQIHYMDWANIDSYIGASLCFLKMNQKDDAAKLTTELVSIFSKDMTPDEMFSAGQILFHSGLKDDGFNVVEQAYKMLHNTK